MAVLPSSFCDNGVISLVKIPAQILIAVVDIAVPYLGGKEKWLMMHERGVLFVGGLEFLRRNCVDPSIELL